MRSMVEYSTSRVLFPMRDSWQSQLQMLIEESIMQCCPESAQVARGSITSWNKSLAQIMPHFPAHQTPRISGTLRNHATRLAPRKQWFLFLFLFLFLFRRNYDPYYPQTPTKVSSQRSILFSESLGGLKKKKTFNKTLSLPASFSKKAPPILTEFWVPY